MRKIVENGERIAFVQLDGGECEVVFSGKYKVFAVQSEEDVTVALESGKTAEDDGVMVCKGGGSVLLPHMKQRDRLYITGTGKVRAAALNDVVNPFKNAGKGGDKENILPYSEGLGAYFDFRKGVSGNSWTDIVGGIKISNVNADAGCVSLNAERAMNELQNATHAFTIYAAVKNESDTTGQWKDIITNHEFGGVQTFSVGSVNNMLSVKKPNGDCFECKSDKEYHIFTMTFLNGLGSFYMDCAYQTSNFGYRNYTTIPYVICPQTDIKMLAVYDKSAHSYTQIMKNMQHIKEKYGI
ncbi:MAG: hypothetical protein NC078_05530 [Ruminococcus sp.]|nr:hypothetical protein [Ruminococcus sp.]